MSKETEAEKQVTLSLDDLKSVVAESLGAVVGEKVAEVVPTAIEGYLKEHGLDQVDRKEIGVTVPTAKEIRDVTDLSEKSVEYLRAVMVGDIATARDLSEGTDSEGGYLVPTEVRAVVTRKIRDYAIFRRAGATVIPMSTDKMDNPFESTQVTVYWTDENDEITQSDAVFGNEQLSVNTLAGITRMSRQLAADANVNVLALVIDMFAQAIAREEDDKFMVGNGTGQPKGLRAYGVTSVAVSSTFDYTDLVALRMLLPQGYRNDPTTCYLAPSEAITQIVSMLGTNGQPIFGPGDVSQARPDTLLGQPLYEHNAIPTNLGAGSNLTEIWYGAMRYYLIGDREQVGSETSTQEGDSFKKHRVAVKVWERVDGRLGLTDAWVKLTAVPTT